MSIRDLYLDPDTWDISISAKDFLTTSDPDAIAQNIRQRLLAWQNEWFLDLDDGTPWRESILGKGQKQSTIEAILKQRISETDGVTGLGSFELSESGERGLSVSFVATTEDGVSVEDIVELSA